MSEGQPKISLYSVNDLKNTTDDALAPYLCNLPKPYTFRQDHTKTDIKLAIGYVAVAIGGILFYADWKLGWDATKPYTAPACVAYFILNGIFTYWIWGVEAGTVFAGVREGGQKLTLKSFSKKNSPTYRLKVKYEAPSGKKWEDKEIEGSYTEWFHTSGRLQESALHSWLAKHIEVIQMADPATKQTAELSYNNIAEDVTVAATSSELVSTPSSTTKKSRKKA